MSRPQRSCRDPHGTVNRYAAGCSCIECCDAWAAYAHEARVGRRYIPRNVDPEPVRRHIRCLLRTLTIVEIARRAGITRMTVRAIRDGRYPSIKRGTADAILGASATKRVAA